MLLKLKGESNLFLYSTKHVDKRKMTMLCELMSSVFDTSLPNWPWPLVADFKCL